MSTEDSDSLDHTLTFLQHQLVFSSRKSINRLDRGDAVILSYLVCYVLQSGESLLQLFNFVPQSRDLICRIFINQVADTKCLKLYSYGLPILRQGSCARVQHSSDRCWSRFQIA